MLEKLSPKIKDIFLHNKIVIFRPKEINSDLKKFILNIFKPREVLKSALFIWIQQFWMFQHTSLGVFSFFTKPWFHPCILQHAAPKSKDILLHNSKYHGYQRKLAFVK